MNYNVLVQLQCTLHYIKVLAREADEAVVWKKACKKLIKVNVKNERNVHRTYWHL